MVVFLKNTEFINQSPKLLGGKWFDDTPDLLFRYDQEKYGLAINSSCPKLDEPIHLQACKFRNEKTLFGDGQDDLLKRVAQSQCAKGVVRGTLNESAH